MNQTPIRIEVSGLVEDAIQERIGIFASFARPHLTIFAKQLGAKISRLPDRYRINAETIISGALIDYADLFMATHLKTLISEFHAHREAMGLPFTPDSSYAFDEFQTHLGNPAVVEILYADHPVLAGLSTCNLTQRLRLLLEVTQNFIADTEVLYQHGLITDTSLQQIRIPGGSDTHNEGRLVTFISTEQEDLVYKPRSMHAEKVASELLNLVNPHLKTPLRLPETVEVENHGWQKKIVPSTANSLLEVSRYAYRLGAFSALFSAIGATDLHCENVIACGEDPMFIDLETLVGLRFRNQTGEPSLPASPLLSSGLIPFYQPGASIDVDVSGVGNWREQESRLKCVTLVDAGTDATRLESQPVQMKHSINLLTLANEPVDLGDFTTEFDAGMTDAIQAIRSETDSIKQIARQHFVVRQVIRPTAVYARFLEAALHPNYLRDSSERRRLFSLLKPLRHLPEEQRDTVKQLEIESLIRGDIPFFLVESSGTTLIAPGLGSASEIIYKSPSSEISASIDHFLGIDPKIHRYLCQTALRSGDAVSDETDDHHGRSEMLSEVWRDGVSGLVDNINQTISELNLGSREHPGWILPGITPHGTVALMPMTAHLYEGGGLLLILACSGNPMHKELAASAIESGVLETIAKADTPVGLSVFSGRPSAALITWELNAAGLTGFDDLSHSFLDEVKSSPRCATRQRDLIGGLAGTAAWLASDPILALRHSSLIEEGIAEMRDLIQSDEIPQHEFAHGKLGLAWALSRTGRLIGDERSCRIAAEHLRHIRDLWLEAKLPDIPKVTHASWCKGGAGALIGLAEGLLNVGEDLDGVRRLVEQLGQRLITATRGRGRDVTPCHGISGAIQALLHVSNKLGDAKLRQIASDLFTERMARVSTEGYNGGLHRSQGHLGYMTGLTGLAHTSVLLASPEVGIPLALTATKPPTGSSPKCRR